MKKALIVGGNSGIGLSCALNLLQKDYEHIYIVGKSKINEGDVPAEQRSAFESRVTSYILDLTQEDYSVFNEIQDIDTLIITSGFGRVCEFESLEEKEISNLIKCNELGVIQVIKKYYHRICSDKAFYTMVMGSIAGHVCSPLFSVYGASKMGLCGFIENVNAELMAKGIENRILDVSPGSIKHTNFSGGGNSVEMLLPITNEMLDKMYNRETLYIPQYEEIYKDVIERYRKNPLEYGVHSYKYKIGQGRISVKPQLIIGYLSGTFDLFHIGHLNMLRRAKEQCDYLIVGVHQDASHKNKETFISFEERKTIVGSCRYVDKVVESCKEDSDAWALYKYNKLFVGSDYKGTERFLRYEEYFKDKDVEIVYFPYTQGTSSTQLREIIARNRNN